VFGWRSAVTIHGAAFLCQESMIFWSLSGSIGMRDYLQMTEKVDGKS
jgi:hypothetical protein